MAESITDTRAKLERARAQVRTLRQHGARAARMTTQVALTGAGGAMAAILQQRMPTIAGLDSRLAVGGALTIAALTELAGDWSDEVLALGGGIVAVQAYEIVAIQLAGAATR